MKLTSLAVLCLTLLLFHTHFGSLVKIKSGKKPSPSGGGSTHTNRGNKNNQGTSSHGGHPKKPEQPNQGGYNQQPGRPAYPVYPQQPSGGGYHNQNPVWGSPYGGHFGSHGRYGGHGSYPGGYINHNPKNKILSPRYGGSFGYGGHHVGGGSPFSHSVQAMKVFPNDKSRGFGRSAVMAAAGGAMVGMALGYGLGRFPRPPFHFRSSQEEYYYNHYMYRKYGVKSTDTNDYSRDYKYSQPSETYYNYMDLCMNRTEVLPGENQKQNNTPAATTATTTTVVTSAPDTVTGSNTTETNNTVGGNSSTSAPSTHSPLNQPKASPVPPASQAVSSAENDDDRDIVEMGYPRLIEQVKTRRCLELYMFYSEKYLKRVTGGVQGLEMGLRGLLAVVSSALVMLLNSNMLTLLH